LLPLVDKPPTWLEISSAAELQEKGELRAIEAAMFAWVKTDEGVQAADRILQFTCFICTRSIPTQWKAANLKLYRPSILSRSENRKHIIFLNDTYNKAELTVPKALTEDRFENLSKVWFLKPVKEEGDLWFHCLGRRRSFGPSIAGLLHAGPSGQ
jgi:hypothetical protein